MRPDSTCASCTSQIRSKLMGVPPFSGFARHDRPGGRNSSLGRARRRRSGLADDLARRLVVAQAEEARVAQAPGAGPLREADLRDELGLDPRDPAFLDRGGVGERRVVAGPGAPARAPGPPPRPGAAAGGLFPRAGPRTL